MTHHPLTFLFTDLENSTRLWEQFPDVMRPALARHDALLKETVEAHRGHVVKTTGDGLHAVFESPSDSVAAALAGQQVVTAESWPEATGPLKVRMGLHTGESQERDGDYYGSAVNRAARIMSSGFGGQILLSNVTAALVQEALPAEVTLLDLGEHCLRDLAQPEHLFQLCHPTLSPDFPPLKSLSAFKHNLPVQLTSFIGRQKELAHVKQLLTQTRLLTLLGPGGTGKTRLALQTAADLLDQFTDGVWFIELAPLTDPDVIPERVAATLNAQEQRGRPLLDTLTNYLQRKELLLLFDNVEHLVRESAELAEHLLVNCPAIKILVTGREALFIGGETTLQIPSLSLPGKTEQTPEQVANSEAVQLFQARARAVHPEFEITLENAPALAEVVRRLDGIPLALELAAARLRMMSVQQIAEHLNDRFRLLTGGRRTALPRQQTLQALIDWSWNLLEEHEHVLLRRLSVFSGGWTLDAAQAVASDDQLKELDIFDHLDQLINKSLVTVEHLPKGEVRYGMLESIRQYARDRLFDAGEGEALRNRHAAYFAQFSESASKGIQGRDMLVWLDRLLRETDNALAMREWALETNLELALRMSAVSMLVNRYWYSNPEGRGWLEKVVGQARLLPDVKTDPESRRLLAKALISLGMATMAGGNFETALPILEEGVSMAKEADDPEPYIEGLNMLVVPLVNMGRFEEAQRIVEEVLELSQKHGWDFQRLIALGSFSPIFTLENLQQAEAYTNDAIRLARDIGNPWINAMASLQKARLEAHHKNWGLGEQFYTEAATLFESVRDYAFAQVALSDSGHMKRKLGNFAGAEQIYRQTIVSFQERGHSAGVAHQLECFGMMAAFQGQHLRAATLLGAAQAIRKAIVVNRLPNEQIEFDQVLAHLAAKLGEAERDGALAAGMLMNMDEAVELALGKE